MSYEDPTVKQFEIVRSLLKKHGLSDWNEAIATEAYAVMTINKSPENGFRDECLIYVPKNSELRKDILDSLGTDNVYLVLMSRT